MIDVENELRQGTIFKPKVDVFDPNLEDMDGISYVSLGFSSGRKVELHAKKEAEQVKAGLTGEFAEIAYNAELRHQLIYWAVIYGLAIDEKPAYQYHNPQTGVKLDLDHMVEYVEYRLGIFREAYELLGLEILTESGLDVLLPDDDTNDNIDTGVSSPLS